MKLHLPLSLRSSLLALLTLTGIGHTVQAAIMSNDASIVTYTDFGQNMGRYKTDSSANALLKYIRQQEGGVVLTYTGGQANYTLEHYMPDFTATTDDGAKVALGYNAIATVQHNNVNAGGFTACYIGADYELKYQAIEYAQDPTETFLHSPGGGYSHGGYDYKVSRLSRVVTDVRSATLFSGAGNATATDSGLVSYANGKLAYHAGGGYMGVYDSNGAEQGLAGAYNYIIGGIDKVGTWVQADHAMLESTYTGQINSEEPLPFECKSGDSGSPYFIYNEEKGRYEYAGALASQFPGVKASRVYGEVEYTNDKLGQYNKQVTSSASQTELHIGAVNTQGETISAAVSNNEPIYGASENTTTVSTTLYSGNVTDAFGNKLQSFVGTKSGVSTWENLSGIIDKDNWYAYGNEFLNAAAFKTSGKDLIHADLFKTDNLCFIAGTAQTNIIMDATVDLGIGYAQFSLAEGQDKARFDISSAGTGNYQFNHAGYVIDANVEVHTTLTGSENYVYEWRKIGDGDLYIEGNQNNKILLNIGGSGTTYLNRTNGYAAYNVLVNTGATIVINDINQIARDLTFGHQGGVLDLNGQSMTWNNDNSVENDGFTIHALDESAIIANLKSNTTSTLTWTQSGAHTFLGSFADNGTDSALQFVYNGGADSKLVLHSIFSSLTAEGSGISVQSGTLTLAGTNTIHAKGSESGRNGNRYTHAQDWHYADTSANITVQNGGIFELGSHARLTGDVTVKSGGIYRMCEGVQHELEYVEGGQTLEDTSKYAAFFGHKGDTVLESGARMEVVYNEDTTARGTYAYNISGAGGVLIDTVNSEIVFSGNNTFSGSKQIVSGGLIATTAASLGDTSTNKWRVTDAGWIAAQALSANELLQHVDSASTGTLALTCDTAEQVDLSGHRDMFVGAERGKSIRYGESTTTLTAQDGRWQLGGGGGELVVDFKLSGDNALVIGAHADSLGIVTLANTANDFSGDIRFNSNHMLLQADKAALGTGSIHLSNDNVLVTKDGSAVQNIATDSAGILSLEQLGNSGVDISSHQNLRLGTTQDAIFSGELTLADGQDYEFTVLKGATLTIESQLSAQHHATIQSADTAGGTVVFAGAETQHLGGLSVTGTGDIALQLAQDVDVHGEVSVGAGKRVDLAGFSLSANGDINAMGAVIADSIGGGELAINADSGKEYTLNADAVQLDNFRKTGAGNVTVDGAGINITNYHVDGGTLYLGEELSLNNANTIYMSGSTLDVGQREMNFNVSTVADSGTSEVVIAGSTVNHVWGIQTDNAVLVNGNLTPGAGSEIKLSGAETFEFSSKIYGSGEGCINVAAPEVNMYIASGYDDGTGKISQGATFLGTLRFSENTTMDSLIGWDNQTYNFQNILVDKGKTLALTESAGYNSVWNVQGLSGEGDILWTPSHNHKYSSRLILSGENDYTGTIKLQTLASQSSYRTFVELASAMAAGHAVINLKGESSGSIASLAVNTTNAQVRGLESNSYSYVYAGAANDNASQSATQSTRAATLTINTAGGEHTFAGTVGQASDTLTNGLSLCKAGSGTQSFTGNAYLNNVSVLGGTLNLASGKTTVKGDVSIATGATLNMGNMTLGSGHCLHVLAGEGTSSAVFSGTLTLSGGQLSFDAAALSNTTAALSLGSLRITNTTGLTVNFTNLPSVMLGSTLKLADGSWSQLSRKISTDMPEYMSASFTANYSGLYAKFNLNSDYEFWDGTEEKLISSKSLVFTDYNDGGLKFSGDKTLRAAIFDNADTFTVGAESDGSLKIQGGIEKYGTGSLTIDTAVSSGGALKVAADTTLLGSGSLSVNNIVLKNGAQVGAEDICIAVSNSISGDGSLQMGRNSTLQVQSTTTGNVQLLDGSTLKIAGGSVNSGLGLSLGETGKASRVSFLYDDYNSSLSVNGALTVQGNTTLSVQGKGALAFNTDFNKLSALELTSGVSLALSDALSTHLILDGGEATAQTTKLILKGDITVKNNGKLSFSGNSDILDYNASGKTITVDGGTIDFGTTRQTIAGWGITLKNGAILTGDGGGYKSAHNQSQQSKYTAALDFNNNATIKVESGVNYIESNMRLRGATLTYNVSKDATLDVSGRMHYDDDNVRGKITKDGEGLLTLTGQTKLATIETKNGEVNIAYTGEGGNTVNLLDGAMGGGTTAQGVLRVTRNASLNITGQFWSRNNTGVLLETGAKLNLQTEKIEFSNGIEGATAQVKATQNTGLEYSLDNGNIEFTHGHVAYSGSSAAELKNKLTDSSVENAGGDKLTVNNSSNTLSGVYATKGSIDILNQKELTLIVLEIATGHSVSAYVGDEASADKEACINVSQAANFGTDVTLNADLVLKNGASLNLEGIVQMGSDVRLETGLTLGGALYESLLELEIGEQLRLFTGIDSLYLGDSSTASGAIVSDDGVQANKYFTNLSDNYYLLYDNSVAGEGVLSIAAAIPEPTTATLSMLALAALAARRRRNRN